MIAARADVVWFMVLASRASRNASRSKAAALAAAAGFAPWFASGDMARGYLGSVGVNLRARSTAGKINSSLFFQKKYALELHTRFNRYCK
jgi:hypothetical protein